MIIGGSMCHEKRVLKRAIELGLNLKQVDWCSVYASTLSITTATETANYAEGYGYILFRNERIKQMIEFMNSSEEK